MARLHCAPGLVGCVWNESSTPEQRAAWRMLPQTTGADCADGAFATLVSGETHVEPAICLRSQVRQAGAQCPMVVLYDDRPETNVSDASQRRLLEAFGAESLLRLTDLLRRAKLDHAPNMTDFILNRNGPVIFGRPMMSAASARFPSAESARLSEGRRLLASRCRTAGRRRRLFEQSEWHRLYLK